MNAALKRAVFSALLVALVSGPILGLRLRTEGVGLVVQADDAFSWWMIAGAVVLMFFWQLLRDYLPMPAALRGMSASSSASSAQAHGVRLSARSLAEPGQAYDVFINGTAASLSGGGIPVGPEVLQAGSLALDMMYGPAAQAFLDWARAHGAVARDGLGMLVEQAAESFALWRGVRPDSAPVLAELRRQLA